MIFEQFATLLGDWRFFWPSTLHDLARIPFAWDSFLNTGIGQPAIGTLWITSYLHLTSSLSLLGISWFWIGLLFWQIPVLLLSFFGAYQLNKKLFGLSPIFSIIGGILYLFNTYFQMLFFGGQAGIALAIALFPYVILTVWSLFSKPTYVKSILFGMTLAGVLLFDPRIFYIAIICFFIFAVIYIKKRNISFFFQSVVVPLIVILSLHMFWILPLVLSKSPGVSQGLGGEASFRFFSFGGFDYALSLLHPNWPDNIFGKVAFLNPIFLILPVLAFANLLYEKSKHTKLVFYFVILAILGAFLAKGANEPFGDVNVFLFNTLPGMGLFRDPTKFYLLVVVSYSVLIPLYLSRCVGTITKKFKSNISFRLVIPFTFLLFFLLINLPMLKKHTFLFTIPMEYQRFQAVLSNDKQFSRTLWLPQWQRYGYFSINHPAIGRQELLQDTSVAGVKQFFSRHDTEQFLQRWSIKYVVIPQDSNKEIFLKENAYADAERKEYERVLSSVSYLTKDPYFRSLAVYRVKNIQDRFSLIGKNRQMAWSMISPTKYNVKAKTGTMEGKLLFSEAYNSDWIAVIGNTTVKSKRMSGMNTFDLPKGVKEAIIEYKPQQLVHIGLIMSGVSLVTWIGLLLRKKYAL